MSSVASNDPNYDTKQKLVTRSSMVQSRMIITTKCTCKTTGISASGSGPSRMHPSKKEQVKIKLLQRKKLPKIYHPTFI